MAEMKEAGWYNDRGQLLGADDDGAPSSSSLRHQSRSPLLSPPSGGSHHRRTSNDAGNASLEALQAFAARANGPCLQPLAAPLEELRSSVQRVADNYRNFFREQIRRHVEVFGRFQEVSLDLVPYVAVAFEPPHLSLAKDAPIPHTPNELAPTNADLNWHRAVIRHLWKVFEEMQRNASYSGATLDQLMSRLVELGEKLHISDTFSSRLSSDYELLRRRYFDVVSENERLRSQVPSGPTPSSSARTSESTGKSFRPLPPSAYQGRR